MTGSIVDRSAPGVRVTVLPDENARSGEPLDLAGRIISFAFEDSERKADKVSFQLDNFDLELFEREDLMGGSVLEVSWGYPGNMSVPRRVVVKKLKGFTTLTVEGQALSVLMNREAKTRAWENVTRSDVARLIAKEHGYEGEFVHIDDTDEKLDVINQISETDARLLTRLASREEYEFFVDDSGFHFHERRQDIPPTHTFTWYSDPGRGDVISLNVESDLVRRAGRVTVKGRDPLQKTTVEASVTSDTAVRTTLGEVIEVVDPESGSTTLQTRNATSSVQPSSSTTELAARQESQARFRKAERKTIKLSMQVVGDPTLHAKSIIEVRGISSLLSGKYYLNEVKHNISSSGYTCDLKLTRDGTGRRIGLSAQSQQQQGGSRNTSQLPKGGEMTQVEIVDFETGSAHIEFRRDKTPIGAGDPEARQ